MALRDLVAPIRRHGATRTRAELLDAAGLPLLMADDPSDALEQVLVRDDGR